jgi:hypothetical protein
MPLVSGDCTFCEGSGKCEECHGTGINPHLNSSEPKCSICSATGVCPECDGSGKGSLWRPHKGSVLKYGIALAAGLIAFFSMFALLQNSWIIVLMLVGWTAFWYFLFYRDSQRKKSAPASRL